MYVDTGKGSGVRRHKYWGVSTMHSGGVSLWRGTVPFRLMDDCFYSGLMNDGKSKC
jgi:hypothetical protein